MSKTTWHARNAVLDASLLYRYVLFRGRGDAQSKTVVWIMLNPSTADGLQDDPTIRRCMSFTEAWNCNRMLVVNLFAYRTSNPDVLWQAQQAQVDIVGPANDLYIARALRDATHVIAAWGSQRNAQPRVDQLLNDTLRDQELLCLKQTREGHPAHPLYIPKHQELEVWRKVPST